MPTNPKNPDSEFRKSVTDAFSRLQALADDPRWLPMDTTRAKSLADDALRGGVAAALRRRGSLDRDSVSYRIRFLGLSTGEIAEQCGVAATTVSSTLTGRLRSRPVLHYLLINGVPPADLGLSGIQHELGLDMDDADFAASASTLLGADGPINYQQLVSAIDRMLLPYPRKPGTNQETTEDCGNPIGGH